ncbi:hypothetical protein [Desulfolithobacter sp.]
MKKIHVVVLAGLFSAFLANSCHAVDEAAASIHSSPVSMEHPDRPQELSERERAWLETFYKGNMLADGWERITEEILSKTPREMQEEQKKVLEVLGEKIGREWCRDNEVRRIDTRMLRLWGERLKQAAEEDPRKLVEVIRKIDQKVDEILN